MPFAEKCALFKKLELPSDIIHRNYHMSNILSIVTNDVNYYYCSTAREFRTMCGEDARYYVPKLDLENDDSKVDRLKNRI